MGGRCSCDALPIQSAMGDMTSSLLLSWAGSSPTAAFNVHFICFGLDLPDETHQCVSRYNVRRHDTAWHTVPVALTSGGCVACMPASLYGCVPCMPMSSSAWLPSLCDPMYPIKVFCANLLGRVFSSGCSLNPGSHEISNMLTSQYLTMCCLHPCDLRCRVHGLYVCPACGFFSSRPCPLFQSPNVLAMFANRIFLLCCATLVLPRV